MRLDARKPTCTKQGVKNGHLLYCLQTSACLFWAKSPSNEKTTNLADSAPPSIKHKWLQRLQIESYLKPSPYKQCGGGYSFGCFEVVPLNARFGHGSADQCAENLCLLQSWNRILLGDELRGWIPAFCVQVRRSCIQRSEKHSGPVWNGHVVRPGNPSTQTLLLTNRSNDEHSWSKSLQSFQRWGSHVQLLRIGLVYNSIHQQSKVELSKLSHKWESFAVMGLFLDCWVEGCYQTWPFCFSKSQ